MKRRELFATTASAALATAIGGSLPGREASAQTVSGSGSASPVSPPLGSNAGSPAGTSTITGDVLPAPDLPFGGEIGLNAAQSQAWWQPRIVPPAGAPNMDAGRGCRREKPREAA